MVCPIFGSWASTADAKRNASVITFIKPSYHPSPAHKLSVNVIPAPAQVVLDVGQIAQGFANGLESPLLAIPLFFRCRSSRCRAGDRGYCLVRRGLSGRLVIGRSGSIWPGPWRRRPRMARPAHIRTTTPDSG